MYDIPLDPMRLRVILAHLEEQMTKNETVGIYLRLQRDAVRRALTAADRQSAPARQEHTSAATGAPDGTGYMIERARHPDAPQPLIVHLDSCTMAMRPTFAVDEDQVRIAKDGLKDPMMMEACEFCRPGTGLDPKG